MVHHRILSYQFLHKLCNKKWNGIKGYEYLKNKIILLDLTQLPLSLHNFNKVTLSWVK